MQALYQQNFPTDHPWSHAQWLESTVLIQPPAQAGSPIPLQTNGCPVNTTKQASVEEILQQERHWFIFFFSELLRGTCQGLSCSWPPVSGRLDFCLLRDPKPGCEDYYDRGSHVLHDLCRALPLPAETSEWPAEGQVIDRGLEPCSYLHRGLRVAFLPSPFPMGWWGGKLRMRGGGGNGREEEEEEVVLGCFLADISLPKLDNIISPRREGGFWERGRGGRIGGQWGPWCSLSLFSCRPS
ncbi:hypothetical protein L345_12450, partial [Ophiophagus hannah]